MGFYKTPNGTTLSVVIVLLTILGCPQGFSGLENGLARTPPAGWVAWQRFTCQTNVHEYPDMTIGSSLFEKMVTALKTHSFLAYGYEYVNIDDCWSERARDANGKLVANSTLFPEGIAKLAQKVHSFGDKLSPDLETGENERDSNRVQAKLGIYGDCGLKTCAGYPGLLTQDSSLSEEVKNYMESDAETFGSWQIDSYKMDGCYVNWQSAEPLCSRMGPLLQKFRPTLVTCEWPFYLSYAHQEPNYTLVAETCNLWRFYDDIEASWENIINLIDHAIRHQETIIKYHGPGHWFDPDQLVIGNNGLSRNQAEAQMALWSVWSAPLFMGNDLRSIRQEDKEILQNSHLLRINRDPLGVWAKMVAELATDDGALQVFVKPVTPIDPNGSGCPSFAVLYLNRRIIGREWPLSFKLRSLLLKAPIYAAANNQPADAHQPIDGLACLKKLADSSQTQLSFLQEDATRHNEPNKTISIDDELRLEVEPSGVRVVKLLWVIH